MNKKLAALLSVSFLLFSCSKNNNNISSLNMNDEVEIIKVNEEEIVIQVGDVIDLRSYVSFIGNEEAKYMCELTNSSLNCALLSGTSNNVLTALKEGTCKAEISTVGLYSKSAFLKINIMSKEKKELVSYLSKINKNYAFLSLQTVEETKNINGEDVTYKTYKKDENDNVIASSIHNVHTDKYFYYDSSSSLANDNFTGYLKNKNEDVYKFEFNNLTSDIDVLPGKTSNDFEDYLFAQPYVIDNNYLKTEYSEIRDEYINIDLFNSPYSLSRTLLTTGLSLASKRTKRDPYLGKTQIIKGDRIEIKLESVSYSDKDGKSIIKKMPVFGIYYSSYYQGEEDKKTEIFNGFYALDNQVDNYRYNKAEEYTDSKEEPPSLKDDTLLNKLGEIKDYKNYTMILEGLWNDDSGYVLNDSLIPIFYGDKMFDNFQTYNYFTENKILRRVSYGDYLNIAQSYIATSGEDLYRGSYIDNTAVISLIYKIDEEEKEHLIISKDGVSSDYVVQRMNITDDGFDIHANDEIYHMKENIQEGVYEISKGGVFLASLIYQGDGIKYYSNSDDGKKVNDDPTILDRGYILKDGKIDKDRDIFKFYNPLATVYQAITDSLEYQKVSSYESSPYYVTDISFSSMNSTHYLFENIIDLYFIDEGKERMKEKLFTQYSDSNVGYYSLFEMFSLSIRFLYTSEKRDVPYRIFFSFSFVYSSEESIYYNVNLLFANFNTTSI